MWRVTLFFQLLLAACASPSLPMWHAPAARIAVGGQEFIVRHDRQRAEVVRVSTDISPGTLTNLVRAKQAMETASGCTVRNGTLYGDSVMAEAYLSCPDAPETRLIPRWTAMPP